MGYTLKPCSESFFGATDRAIEEEVTKKVDQYVNMLLQSAEDCEDEGVIQLTISSRHHISLKETMRRPIFINY